MNPNLTIAFVHAPEVYYEQNYGARFAPVWAVIRILIGYTWITAGLHKLGDADWTETGEALKGYWMWLSQEPKISRPGSIRPNQFASDRVPGSRRSGTYRNRAIR